MNREDIKAYVHRPWHLLEESDAEHWLARKRELGAAEGLRMGDELRAWVALVRPDWPSPEQRAEDLAAHIRVSEALRSVTLPRSA